MTGENTNPQEQNSNSGAPQDGGADDIQARIDEAVAGLKKNNAELKNEKTKFQEQYNALNSVIEELGGVDSLKQLGNGEAVKNLIEMKKRLEADETGKMLAEGKYDEWFDKRTAALRKDHENQIANLQAQLEESNGKVTSAEEALRKKVLETEVSSACMDAGVESSAMLDVQLRAANTFTFDQERGKLVLKDEDGGVVFGKDGSTPKTVREWLEDQKETSRHWWPNSRGGGADGSDLPGGKKGLAKLDMRSYAEERKKQGFKTF